jgi:hypothetical protein
VERVISRIAPTIRDYRALPKTAKARENYFSGMEHIAFGYAVTSCTEK